MKESFCQTAVAIIFFNRSDTLSRVFQSVREARPKKLFLIQDGARAGKNEEEKVLECRRVVSDIDWECEVFRNYSEENLSCDHREYTGISWAFEHTDRLIVLEDDCLPCADFYPFCDELLEKYKDNTQVSMISGTARLGHYDTKYSYNFSQAGCGWGWALWKRTWDEVQEFMKFTYLEDDETYKTACNVIKYGTSKLRKRFMDEAKRVYMNDKRTEKYTSWEFALSSAIVLAGKLIITPNSNMVSNIGISGDATHTVDNIRKMPKYLRKYYDAPIYSMEFPLKHPPYIMRDFAYEKKYFKWHHVSPFLKGMHRLDGIFRRYIYGTKEERRLLFQKMKAKLFKNKIKG